MKSTGQWFCMRKCHAFMEAVWRAQCKWAGCPDPHWDQCALPPALGTSSWSSKIPTLWIHVPAEYISNSYTGLYWWPFCTKDTGMHHPPWVGWASLEALPVGQQQQLSAEQQHCQGGRSSSWRTLKLSAPSREPHVKCMACIKCGVLCREPVLGNKPQPGLLASLFSADLMESCGRGCLVPEHLGSLYPRLICWQAWIYYHCYFIYILHVSSFWTRQVGRHPSWPHQSGVVQGSWDVFVHIPPSLSKGQAFHPSFVPWHLQWFPELPQAGMMAPFSANSWFCLWHGLCWTALC